MTAQSDKCSVNAAGEVQASCLQGKGSLARAYPKTPDGLQRLEADIEAHGAEALGHRHGVTKGAVDKLHWRRRQELHGAGGDAPVVESKPSRIATWREDGPTWQEIADALGADFEEERRLEDLERHPWKRDFLPKCRELVLLPVGAGDKRKAPVDLKTGCPLEGWERARYTVEELQAPNGFLRGVGFRPGPESGHIAVLDIDGAEALALCEGTGCRVEDVGWVTRRGNAPDRLKVSFRIPEADRSRLERDDGKPIGKVVLTVRPPDKEKGVEGQQLELFYGSGQCIIAGEHQSGGVYVPEGSPETATEPTQEWWALIQKVLDEGVSHPEGPSADLTDVEIIQSGPGYPCPVCGRDTSSACTVFLDDDRPRVNCHHGNEFAPPMKWEGVKGGFLNEVPLAPGDPITGADGKKWAFTGTGVRKGIGTYSTFRLDGPSSKKKEQKKSSKRGGSVYLPTYQELEGRYFTILGWSDNERDGILYRAKRTGQISIFRCKNPNEMLKLAPLDHWVEIFGHDPVKEGEPRTAPPKWSEAMSAVIWWADHCGVFDQSSLRGEGVWMDGDQVVWHLGSRLEVNGELTSLDDFDGRNNYIRAPKLPIDPQVVLLQNNEGEAVLNLIRQMGWVSAVDALHLAGWIVLANVGGALPKRPGLQLTSSTGSGKSDCVTEVIQPLLAGLALYSSGSTEAGVRQLLGDSSLPAVIDESEQENTRQRENHLRLVRYAYDGVPQVKGTPSGEALSFALRSSICLVGINATIPNPADRNRIVVISRRQVPGDEWEKVGKRRAELITRETGVRLVRRTVSNLKTLLANVQTFGRVVARRYGGRAGDTYGALLAGAHHLTSLEVIDEDQAGVWIAAQRWSLGDEQVAESTAQDEAEQCLEHLLKHEVPFLNDVPFISEASGDFGRISDSSGRASIREVIRFLTAMNGEIARGCGGEFIKSGQIILGRRGLRVFVEEQRLLVHTGKKGSLKDIYEGTRWANGAFTERLLDLPGSERVPTAQRINPLGVVKCIALPLSLIVD